MKTFAYYQRILQAYIGQGTSQLSFWHGEPLINEEAFNSSSDQFYMRFHRKAQYQGPFDGSGVPLVNYRGNIGAQYNPIAIAQYGLGCWNLWRDSGDNRWIDKAIVAANWHAANLQHSVQGQWVWMHDFDWEYFQILKAPWYSGLAQGQGLALLARMYKQNRQPELAEAARKAIQTMLTPVADGGTLHVDGDGCWWIEEYITDPPTHILNGHIWALWGVYDYARMMDGDEALKKKAEQLWEEGVRTLIRQLDRFDAGFWSTYDQAPTRMRNLASPFYHKLHLVQLEVMYRLTGEEKFREVRDRWQGYQENSFYRKRAFVTKALFKLLYF